MHFDEQIDRRGSNCDKWDNMEAKYGVSPEDGLAMWVADGDFRPPACVQQAVQDMAAHGIYGYYGALDHYHKAICWWMETRHNWRVDPDWIFTTHGLGNGIAMCVESFTEAKDGVVLFSPVYHSFYRIIKASGRAITECPLVNNQGRYEFDFEAYDSLLTGAEKMLVLCSPQNPGGRVWSKAELQGIADFAKRHDLIIVSDEIHHDLIYPGKKHIAMPLVDASIRDRLVMMTATTKSFNIAGCHTGNVIIEDRNLRARFGAKMRALALSPNSFGIVMATAAYSPDGALWIDGLMRYLNENRAMFETGLNAIPGAKAMQLEATYLSWIDFTDTGMTPQEISTRVEKGAKIAANHGATFGTGGDYSLRFNLALPKQQIEEAVGRLQTAFGDLQ